MAEPEQTARACPQLTLATGTFDGMQVIVEIQTVIPGLMAPSHSACAVVMPDGIDFSCCLAEARRSKRATGFAAALERFEKQVLWDARTGHRIADHIGNDAPGFLPDEAAALVALNMELLMLYSLEPDREPTRPLVAGPWAMAQLMLLARIRKDAIDQRHRAKQAAGPVASPFSIH